MVVERKFTWLFHSRYDIFNIVYLFQCQILQLDDDRQFKKIYLKSSLIKFLRRISWNSIYICEMREIYWIRFQMDIKIKK